MKNKGLPIDAIISPVSFAIHISKGTWKPASHLLLLEEKLIALKKRKLKRLIVSMPPRHGKSSFLSLYFPAWYLFRNPTHKIILTSYEADFASSWGRKVRDIFLEFGREWGREIREDSQAVYRWELKTGGGMYTAGVGGPITGKGGDLIIVDDPIKNAEEANSKTMREKLWDWYKSTLYTRLEPNGILIVIATRWHEDDLIGRLIKTEKNDWEILNLPAIAEEDEDYGIFKRKKGEALWPERYPVEELLKIKASIGDYWWNALYQGHPSPYGGGLFKREYFRYYESKGTYFLLHGEQDKLVSLADCTIIQTVDLATSLKEKADYFVIGTFAITQSKDIIVLDIYRERCEGPEQKIIIKNLYERFKPAYIGIESVQYQVALAQDLQHEGYPVKKLISKEDKWSRALGIATRYQAGKVYHPIQSSWLNDFEEELLLFPVGEHDDQVDVISYCGLEVLNLEEPIQFW
jgi:predicted phage terminase large subunit-like protein